MSTIHHHQLLLASNSPRRKELLGMISPDYKIARIHDIDESYPSDMPHMEIPEYLSKIKAEAYKDQLETGEILITADTMVICDGKMLGKPHSRGEAIDMLTRLKGKTHHVVTGVTLTSIDKSLSFSETTEVTFDHISDSDIEWYVDNYRPFDKAGAYGIQEWIGCIGIKGIKGCFYNVMGLPLNRLYRAFEYFS